MKSTAKNAGVPLVFTIIWSLMTLGFDGAIGYMFWQALRSYQFTETPGSVTTSHVDESREKGGKRSYRPKIEYEYQVDGKTLHGTRCQFSDGSVSGTGARNSVRKIVDRYPVGAKVTVFYDPERPETAVLEHGITGTELFMLLFMTPFNGIMLGLWSGTYYHRVRGNEEPLQRLLRQTAYGWEIHERCGLITAFLVGVSAAAFIMIFPVVFGIGFQPSLLVMEIVWSIVLLAGVVATVFILGYPQGAAIDDMDGTITLRGWFGATKASVPRSLVKSVDVNQGKSQEGSPVMFEVVLTYEDDAGLPQTASIVSGQSRERADAVQGWMQEKLGIRTTGLEASEDM